jgi:hypothetical protein
MLACMGTEKSKLATNPARPPSVKELPSSAYAHLIEIYTPERIAEFLLNNAVNAEDYASSLEEVRKLGIDPATIPHEKPPRV